MFVLYCGEILLRKSSLVVYDVRVMNDNNKIIYRIEAICYIVHSNSVTH